MVFESFFKGDESDEESAQRMADFFGPGQVDQTIPACDSFLLAVTPERSQERR